MDPITIGLAAGGLGSLLGGLFNQGPGPLPPLQFSPESLKSINFSDINLEQMNPELFHTLMENDALIKNLHQMMDQQRSGPSTQQLQQMESQRNDLAGRLAAMGLAGSSVGEGMSQKYEMDARNNMANQVQQSQLGMTDHLANLLNAQFGMHRQALGDIVQNQQANRNAALQMDQMKNAQAMSQYQNEAQNAAARNQFFSGLGNSMLGAAGNMYSQNQTNKRFPYLMAGGY